MEAQPRELVVLLPGTDKSHADSFGICASMLDPDIVYCSNLNAIYEISLSRKTATLYAGDLSEKGDVLGELLTARFSSPKGLHMTADGRLFVADFGNEVIKVIENGIVSLFAGTGASGRKGGPKESATFHSPFDIAEHDGVFYIADAFNKELRVIDREGEVTKLEPLGPDNEKWQFGQLASVFVGQPWGLEQPDPILYVSAWDNNVVAINLRTQTLEVTSSDLGVGDAEEGGRRQTVPNDRGYSWPCGIEATLDGQLFIADNENHVIRRYADRTLYTVDGKIGEQSGETATPFPTSICITLTGDLIWSEWKGRVMRIPRVYSPPITNNFMPIFNNPTFADLSIQHSTSSTTFQLKTDVLQLHKPISLDILRLVTESTALSGESISHFFRVLYGSNEIVSLAYGADKANLLLDLLFLAQALDYEALVRIIASELSRCISNAAATTVEALLARTNSTQGWKLSIAADVIRERSLALEKQRISRLTEPSQPSDKPVTSLTPLFEDSHPQSNWRKQYLTHDPPSTLLKSALTDYASKLSLLPSADYSLGNFAVSIADQAAPCTVMVHEWVLYSSWPYFRRLFDSGLSEFQSKSVSLPSHFPPELLLKVLRYIYSGDWDVAQSTTAESSFILDEGGEFGFVDMDRNPCPGFERMVQLLRR